MALDQFALLEVLDALKAADVGDRVRQAAETVYQALIEAELTETIGAALHERSESRTALRNGHRTRTLSTTAGDLELRIPKLRTGSFFPSLLERRRRVDQALFAVVMEAYLHGVSTRMVDDLVKALGADTGISKPEVSRICADLDAEVGPPRPVVSRVGVPVRVPRRHVESTFSCRRWRSYAVPEPTQSLRYGATLGPLEDHVCLISETSGTSPTARSHVALRVCVTLSGRSSRGRCCASSPVTSSRAPAGLPETNCKTAACSSSRVFPRTKAG